MAQAAPPSGARAVPENARPVRELSPRMPLDLPTCPNDYPRAARRLVGTHRIDQPYVGRARSRARDHRVELGLGSEGRGPVLPGRAVEVMDVAGAGPISAERPDVVRTAAAQSPRLAVGDRYRRRPARCSVTEKRARTRRAGRREPDVVGARAPDTVDPVAGRSSRIGTPRIRRARTGRTRPRVRAAVGLRACLAEPRQVSAGVLHRRTALRDVLHGRARGGPAHLSRFVSVALNDLLLPSGSWREGTATLRLMLAVLFLSCPELSVLDVSSAVGYARPEAMANAFQRAGLLSPRDVRLAFAASRG